MVLPTVYAYDPSDDPADCSLICDNEGAGRQAAEYLLGIGRRRIAIVGGLDFFQATIDRERGALDTLRMAGAAPLLVINDRWSEDWGERAANYCSNAMKCPMRCTASTMRSRAACAVRCRCTVTACHRTSRSSGTTIGTRSA